MIVAPLYDSQHTFSNTEGLERFAELFTLDAIETTVAKPSVIPREIGRVDSELDRTSDASRAFYFLKSNFDPDHPFAR
jgi:hypothetical protein